MKMVKKYLPLMGLILSAGIAGCVAPFSKGVRQQVDKSVHFEDILANPEAYRDKVVIIGGKIIQAKPGEEYTELEVLEQPLGFDFAPMGAMDQTAGRFLLLVKGFLDPAVYSTGRRITTAARVQGVETRNIGEKPYNYPVLEALQVKLWPPSPETVYVRRDPMDILFWGPYGEPYWGPPHPVPPHRW